MVSVVPLFPSLPPTPHRSPLALRLGLVLAGGVYVDASDRRSRRQGALWATLVVLPLVADRLIDPLQS